LSKYGEREVDPEKFPGAVHAGNSSEKKIIAKPSSGSPVNEKREGPGRKNEKNIGIGEKNVFRAEWGKNFIQQDGENENRTEVRLKKVSKQSKHKKQTRGAIRGVSSTPKMKKGT